MNHSDLRALRQFAGGVVWLVRAHLTLLLVVILGLLLVPRVSPAPAAPG